MNKERMLRGTTVIYPGHQIDIEISHNAPPMAHAIFDAIKVHSETDPDSIFNVEVIGHFHKTSFVSSEVYCNVLSLTAPYVKKISFCGYYMYIEFTKFPSATILYNRIIDFWNPDDQDSEHFCGKFFL